MAVLLYLCFSDLKHVQQQREVRLLSKCYKLSMQEEEGVYRLREHWAQLPALQRRAPAVSSGGMGEGDRTRERAGVAEED